MQISSHLYKVDNFCDFLLAFLHYKPFLENGMLQKERICVPWEQCV